MAQPELRRLLPDASQALCNILDSTQGAAEPPVRSEIFGPQRFAQHGHSLALTHRAALVGSRATTFFPRLKNNILVLGQAHSYISEQATTGYDISPAAEWLLDNFHLIEAQLKEIHEGLPRSYFRQLPVLLDEPLAGLPRVYGVAWAFIAHTDGAFDEDLLSHFLIAYQETTELNLSEIWALPTTLRVVLIENLRRLAQRVATNKAAREAANLCCDHLGACSVKALEELLSLLASKGVGRMFLAQMAQRLLDTQATHLNPYRDWVGAELPDLAAFQLQLPADQAADNLSMRNAITSLRAIGDADWPDIVARTSPMMRLMLTSAVFEAEDATTRDQSLHGIELLAKRSGKTELAVARVLFNRIQEASKNDGPRQVASYWLRGAGYPSLARALGIQNSVAFQWRQYLRRLAVPAYLGFLALGTVGIVTWLLRKYGVGQTGVHLLPWLTALGLFAIVFPASEAVLAVMNRLISESARPRHLPRLALTEGIPADHRVIVVIPAMLSSAETVEGLAHRMLLHYLANPERHAQFAMLTDWSDADSETSPTDGDLLHCAIEQVNQLNLRYPQLQGDAPMYRQLSAAIFAEDVQLSDEGALWAMVGVHGPTAAGAISRAMVGTEPSATRLTADAMSSWPEYANAPLAPAGRVMRLDHYGTPGFVLRVPVEARDLWTSRIRLAGATPLAAEVVEFARVEAGRPEFLVDMDADTIPLEAGIEDRAISFTKGCYVGQEVIVRVVHRGGGRVARKLVGLKLDTSAVPGARATVRAARGEVGRVTSAAWSPRQRATVALAYVHRDFVEPGTTLTVDCDGTAVPAVVSAFPIR